MSLTGGISFFAKNKALFVDGSTLAASSNTADQNLPLGTNKFFSWESIGSNDATTETLTITLPVAKSISRIFLVGHNFDDFQIQYGASQNFANVKGLDNYAGALISETGFTRDTAYYEFDAVTTDKIIVTIDTTQIANAQKFISQIIITDEIGTLTGFPNISNPNFDRDERSQKAASGRVHIEKGFESASFGLDLKTYGIQADIDILEGLHDRNESFIVWLNGGLPDNFRLKQRGFRVGDIFQMQTTKGLKTGYYKNLYKSGVMQTYGFQEVV
ncbi:MAG: hypothetical protein ACUZ8H_06225 [Candidatus Anammoxibacter sp.]